MTAIYIPTETYKKLTEALASLEPCPTSGLVTEDQIKIALGEVGGIWPDSIRERHDKP